MTPQHFIDQVNEWGAAHTPFFFMIDFEMKRPHAFKLSELDESEIKVTFPEYSNSKTSELQVEELHLKTNPISLDEYNEKFQVVANHLTYGDSFLTNLTIKTAIETKLSLEEIYNLASAPYKLWYKNKLVVYSPESFVKIRDGKIFSYPMKGTIDASVENAEQKILADGKEFAEHVTIVDLIRNDLSIVADNVEVKRFRFIDRIKTQERILLQVSSEITGDLPLGYSDRLGSLIWRLLPAGSISGAPKKKTVEIIEQAEGEHRGFYTGVMGFFDGTNLDSAVMIRCIEANDGKLFYRSGGGITTQSDCEQEYKEALAKIYVPVI
ncbi:aminodeoxychorismate synthase component I [Chryseotalea sanaruensis]|uniref:Aminodeoxychorismate synthase component I n=1 Tax=Chryseotalea sanaruensis TaxID=2482724 RepID=A0A401UBD9_9BACT|nr:aminodeoxychorismate synthase component I [Chryseotalea sanaruensis]GCC52228.1 aminodeoxychorismate synthase component I [Chryseotalea sanaruensis]